MLVVRWNRKERKDYNVDVVFVHLAVATRSCLPLHQHDQQTAVDPHEPSTELSALIQLSSNFPLLHASPLGTLLSPRLDLQLDRQQRNEH
jgi:hypothetical protein